MFDRFYIDFIEEHKKRNIESGFKFKNVEHDGHLRRQLKFQRHHILPKSVNGKNEATNYVYLSHDDHKYAHVLLAMSYIEQNHDLNEIKNVSAYAIYEGCYINRLFNDCPEIKSAIRFVIETIDNVSVSMTVDEAINMVCILKNQSPLTPENRIKALGTLFNVVYGTMRGKGTFYGRAITIEWKRNYKFIRMN